jgi:hypothetical protein
LRTDAECARVCKSARRFDPKATMKGRRSGAERREPGVRLDS